MCVLAGTNLEDEDVLAKNVMDIDGRTVRSLNSCWYHSHVPRMVCCVVGIIARPSALTIPPSYLGPHIAVGMGCIPQLSILACCDATLLHWCILACCDAALLHWCACAVL